ncbi:mannitol dehydrogenase family protein [Kocuria oceani]|uniref:mannitol dehydrogenase family protein n=1 Tax=Kocuria oceani TaxID=988827 RepID=UPI0040361255
MHLGVGAFHRAHQAVLTEDAMLTAGDTRWGITGVTQRSRTVVDQLGPQDGLFTVTERGDGAAPLRVVSSIREVLPGHDEPEQVIQRIGAPATTVVTLTITEKGYRIDPRTGRLDLHDPQIRRDLAGAPARTAIGQIARGLQQRHRTGAGAINVISCDNLPANGVLTRTLVTDFIAALPSNESDLLHAWIQENVAFPDTMVDRMVPVTTSADLDAVEQELGLRDEGAVIAEPFFQWVLEDHFLADRPRWEDAGALLTTDVGGWEAAKLRLLNASHSLLAYLGLATGKRTIAEAVAEEAFHTACRRMMDEDVLPTLDLPKGLDGQEYTAKVLERFANPALGHTTTKVGNDGSQKLGPRLLSTITTALAAGHPPRWATLAVAAWMHRVATAPADELDDPLAPQLKASLPASAGAADVVQALLGRTEVFPPELAANTTFRDLLIDWYRIIDKHGLEGLRNEIHHG